MINLIVCKILEIPSLDRMFGAGWLPAVPCVD